MTKKKKPYNSMSLREKIESLKTYYFCTTCDPYGFYDGLVELNSVLAIVAEEEMRDQQNIPQDILLLP